MNNLNRFLFWGFIVVLNFSNYALSQWELTNSQRIKNLFNIAADNSNIYVATYDSGVFRSTDAGVSWTQVNYGLDYFTVGPLMLAPDGSGGTNLFAGEAGGVYRSTNNGKVWNVIDAGLSHWNISTLGFNDHGIAGTTLFAGSGDGFIFRSTNNGTQWIEADSGTIKGQEIMTIASCPGKTGGTYLFALTLARHVFRSTNDGLSWTEADSGLGIGSGGFLVISRHKTGEVTLFVSGMDGFWRSTDYGTTWNIIYQNATYALAVTSDDTGGQVVFAGNNGIIMSTDDGNSWTSVGTGLSESSYNFAITPNRKMIFAASSPGLWRRALNEMIGPPILLNIKLNDRWNLVSVPSIVTDYRTTTLFPAAVSAAYEFGGNYSAQDTLANSVGYWIRFSGPQIVSISGLPLERSAYVHSGWNLIGSISTPVVVEKINSIPAGIVTSQFFGYRDGYIQCDTLEPGQGYWVKSSQDGSLVLYSPFDSESFSSRICMIPTTERPPQPPDEELMAPNRPRQYNLDQCYPDPFNPTTTITYDLPFESTVRLKIFNLIGQVVATLTDKIEPAGHNVTEWDGSSFPSGIYFYRLDAVSTNDRRIAFSSVKKMVLCK